MDAMPTTSLTSLASLVDLKHQALSKEISNSEKMLYDPFKGHINSTNPGSYKFRMQESTVPEIPKTYLIILLPPCLTHAISSFRTARKAYLIFRNLFKNYLFYEAFPHGSR